MQDNSIDLLKGIWKPKLIAGMETFPWVVIFMLSGFMVVKAGVSWWCLLGIGFYVICNSIGAFCNSKDPLFFAGIWRFMTVEQDFYANTAMHPSKNNPMEY